MQLLTFAFLRRASASSRQGSPTRTVPPGFTEISVFPSKNRRANSPSYFFETKSPFAFGIRNASSLDTARVEPLTRRLYSWDFAWSDGSANSDALPMQ